MHSAEPNSDGIVDPGDRGVAAGAAIFQPAYSQQFGRCLAPSGHRRLIGAFVVWWQNIEGGFFYLVSGTVLSALLLFAAGLVIQCIRGRIVRKITANESLREKFPI